MDRLAEKVGITGLGDAASATSCTPGDDVGPGPDHGRRVCRGRRPAWTRCRPGLRGRLAGTARRSASGLGLKNSGLGNGFLEIAKAVVRFRADGRIEVRHCWTEMGQGVHSVALQVAVTELGVDPDRIDVLVDTSRELGAGQTTGSRGTVMGAGSVAEACRAALDGGCRPEVDYEGEYRVDWTQQDLRRARAPGHPLRLRLRRPAGDRRPRQRARSSKVVAVARRRQGGEPDCCARARSRGRSTWASATP